MIREGDNSVDCDSTVLVCFVRWGIRFEVREKRKGVRIRSRWFRFGNTNMETETETEKTSAEEMYVGSGLMHNRVAGLHRGGGRVLIGRIGKRKGCRKKCFG
jgi:hypothetical protein